MLWEAVAVIVVATLVCDAATGLHGHVGGLPRTQCERIRIPECQGLGYNVTLMPNMLQHATQVEAQEAMQAYNQLFHLGCSLHLRFFLCSLFVPMCSEEVSAPIPTCRSHCLQVRADCEPTLQRLSLTWPAEIVCDHFPVATSMCIQRPDHEEITSPLPALNIHHHHQPPPACVDHDIFSTEDKQFAEKWSTGWGWLCFLSTLFTLLTWTVQPARYRYPERPVVFLAVCYGVQAIVYVLRGALGAPQHTGPCLVSSVILYYSSLAGAAWWVAFVLSWWLSAARDWSSEALANSMAPRLHLACWGGPLLVTTGVFWEHVATVDVPCELQSPYALLIPHIILIIITGVMAIFAGRALIRVRRTLRASGRSAGKLERLMTRLALYVLLYMLLATGWLICSAWIPVSCATSHVELGLLKVFLSLMVGIMSGMWVWSSKTCRAWSKLLGPTPPGKSRRPMPISRV